MTTRKQCDCGRVVGYNQEKPRRKCVCGRPLSKAREFAGGPVTYHPGLGLGDLVERVAKKLRLWTCGGCNKRKHWLNKLPLRLGRKGTDPSRQPQNDFQSDAQI